MNILTYKISGTIYNNKSFRAIVLILMLIAYAMLFQGSRGLWERDEGRYTNIAVRMLQSGNLLEPSLNDDAPHFAKPPLTYWAIAGGIKLLGWSEWGVRLPNALAFVCTVLLIYAISRRITPERPWLSPVIYATSLLPFIASNIVTTDTLLTLFETMAVTAFICWWHHKDASVFLIIMWAGFGLSFLTKGPPGLLSLLVIFAFILLTDGWKSLSQIISPSGLALFLLFGFGWYITVAAIRPGMVKYFLADEVAGRIFTGMYHRNPEWYKGFAIYIPTLMIGTLPWTFSLLSGARSIHRTLLSITWWREKLNNDPWTPFLFLWVLLPLLVFFLSKSRLWLYILPLFVPVSLITGRLPIFHSRVNRKILLLAIWIIMLIGLKFAASRFPYDKDNRTLARAIADIDRPLPAEVVFVDADPYWGLSLYLQCEVEPVVSSSPAKTSLTETLAEEFDNNEPGSLFIAKKNREAEVIKTCRSLGYPVRTLGQTDKWVFMILEKD
jgi:4-amino-4-deoxy-L-arabinose transferase-like glycosyltransferase